jgi:hypothetical protein
MHIFLGISTIVNSFENSYNILTRWYDDGRCFVNGRHDGVWGGLGELDTGRQPCIVCVDSDIGLCYVHNLDTAYIG